MAGGMVKIDTIVREVLGDRGYPGLHMYLRCLVYAIRILRRINIDHSEDVKTVVLPVSKTKTVKYPDDYITYNKLGIKLGDRTWCFVRDNTITNHHTDKYTANKPFFEDAISKVSTLRFFNYYQDSASWKNESNTGYVDIRGYAHNGLGYFKPIDSCREFQLSSDVSVKNILLEYVSNNFNPDTETFVSILVQDVIRSYIHSQLDKFSKTTTLSQQKDSELEFLYELSDYDQRLSDLSYQGILDSCRINSTLAIKG